MWKTYLAWTTWSCVSVVSGVTNLHINTTSGPVYGMINGSHPDVAQFLGIPFAAAPVGDLRFAPPATYEGRGTIDATRQGSLCPQYLLTKANSPSVYTYDTPWLQPEGPVDEDCLTLDIRVPYTPQESDAEPLPVLIWVFGGGFYEGGTRTLGMDGSPWIQRTKSHIIVAINYRNNIFGFPNARGLADTGLNLNLGLLDQRFAVEWIRDNIANFGGDPQKMYLWGQSSGAASVDYYNYAWYEDRIVKGLIMHSGSVFATGTSKDPSHTNFTFVAQNVGCGNLSARGELECMRTVSWESIVIDFYEAYNLNHTTGTLGFTTVVDNQTKFLDYESRTLAGKWTGLPAVMGNDQWEMTSLLTWPGDAGYPNISDVKSQTLSRHVCPGVYASELRAQVNATTWKFYNTANFTNVSPRPWEGAYHTSELAYLFGTYAEYNLNIAPLSALEVQTAEAWQDLYVAFMKDPQHGLTKSGWPQYRPNGQVMMFGGNGTKQATQLIDAQVLETLCKDILQSN